MQKLSVCILVFFVFISNAFAQKPKYYQIKGNITASDTKLPLQGASVFAENTTLGTVTDDQGNFSFWLPEGGFDMAVSFTGYQTQSQHVSNGIPAEFNISLAVKQKEMQEVSVVSTGEVKDGWAKYGTFFLSEFLGNTPNRKLCTLQNSDALRFFYSKRKDRLKVLAKEPLHIENKALGYLITYELDSFIYEYKTTNALYTGVPKFDTLVPENSAQMDTWKQNRETAYYGSVLHFMRAIYKQQIADEGYELKEVLPGDQADKMNAIEEKNIFTWLNYETKENGLITINPAKSNLGILYTLEAPAAAYLTENPETPNKEFQYSKISFTANQPITIESNGYYYPQQDLVINDYWEWTRMADMLPYNYIADE